MTEIKAPDTVTMDPKETYVFLAGSIEMDKAEPWQAEVVKRFATHPGVNFFNPRRSDWDSSWGEDSPQLIQQIQWELRHLRAADLVVFYFDPRTQSPITLLELGLILERTSDVIVCCPPGYFRRTNVVTTCVRYKVRVLSNFEDLIMAINGHPSINGY